MKRPSDLPAPVRPPVFAATKFLAPPPPMTMIERPHLLDRIDAARDLPVTLVVGSPGSGKSSLLSSWVHRVGPADTVWLSADRGDHDPVRFWRAVITALQRLVPDMGTDAVDLISLDRAVGEDALESLLVDDSVLDRRITLVIDDMQFVSPDATRHLQHLLERGLQHLRLIIGSRRDPAIGLHRLRLRHQVAEIRESDLRFGLSETDELLTRLGLHLTGTDVAALHHRTEGWAAGVQMAGLSVVGADDTAARVRDVVGNHQTIAGYLASEVMANQTDRVRRFLEDTCIVDELDAEMCEALTAPAADEPGSAQSERVTLLEIEAANLLINRIDESGTAYRYHPMFASMLRDRLRTTQPERYREQHRRAAAVCLRAGRVDAAVRHLSSAGRTAEAARLVHEQVLDVYLGTGTPPPAELHIGLGSSTDESATADVAGAAIALIMNGRPADADALLDRFETIVPTGALDPAERLTLHALRTGTALTLGKTAAAVTKMREFVAAMEQPGLADNVWIAVTIPLGIRAAVWEGRLDLADRLAERFPPDADRHLAEVDLPAALAFVSLERGDHDQARMLSERALAAAAQLGVVGSGADVAARAVLASVLVETVDLDAASVHLAAALDSHRLERIPSYVLASLARVRMLSAQGAFDAALGAISAARVRLGTSATTLSARIDMAEIAVRCTLGDLGRAEELLRHLPPSRRARTARCWVDLAAGRLDEAASGIDALSSIPPSTCRERLDLALLHARLELERSGGDAHDRCDDVLAAAQASGAVLSVAEAGSIVLDHIVRAARHHERTPYIERLSAARPVARPLEHARPRSTMDELSPREVVVLRYMATSMSNQEIADALYLSVNTVKTHVKHVLRKLGATNRPDAVRRARELDYL